MSDWKPCPFCGGRHIETAENLDLVYCFDCGAEMHTDLGGGWNTRPIEDALTARIAELEEKLAELVEAADKMCDVTEDILEGDTVEMIYCRGIAEEARDVLKGE